MVAKRFSATFPKNPHVHLVLGPGGEKLISPDLSITPRTCGYHSAARNCLYNSTCIWLYPSRLPRSGHHHQLYNDQALHFGLYLLFNAISEVWVLIKQGISHLLHCLNSVLPHHYSSSSITLSVTKHFSQSQSATRISPTDVAQLYFWSLHRKTTTLKKE